jgi:type I restriction enzyme S subunit
MTWKPYPAHKPSGVAWLGNVPEQWQVKRLKYSATINDDALPESTAPDFEFDYVDIGSVNAAEGITTKERMVFDNAPSRARRRVKVGDTIVSTVRTYLRAIAPIEDSAETTIVSTGFAIVRPRKVEPSYLAYALREASFVESIVARSTGVSYPAVNASEVGCIPIPLPPSPEQLAIAAFLDRETGKIDRLVAKNWELIEKLKEERAALISRTVTRGLNPNAKLKPSGVEWLGEVPEQWDIWKVSQAFSTVGSGTTPPTSEAEWYDGDICWVTTSELRESVIVDTGKKVTKEALWNFSALKLFPKGALAIAMYGATIGRLGILGVEATTNQACCVLAKAKRIDIQFMFYWFQAFRDQIVLLATGGGQPNICQDKIRSLRVACPPLSEQLAIASFLDRETGKINRLAAKVAEAIGRLQEYRAALITAAVTGKIEVSTALDTGGRAAATHKPLVYPEPMAKRLIAAEGSGAYGEH